MSRSLKALDSLRTGTAGLLLFYGYLLAILVVSVILLRLNLTNDAQNSELQRQSIRQCLALKGAVNYWTEAREAVRLRLSDYTRSPAARLADARLLSALDHVIERGAPLTCDGKDG